jgi:hypothetical protein
MSKVKRITKVNGKLPPYHGKLVPLPDGRKYYLAYGSNLNVKAMASRCPDAKPVCSLILVGCRLVFRGVADLEYDSDGRAAVGVWDISEADERKLDGYEGYPNFYQKYDIPLTKTVKALCYLMVDRDGIMPPSAYYASVLRDGYRHFGLAPKFLDDAVTFAYTDKTPTEQTRARRKRQLNSSHQQKLVRMPESVALARLEAREQRRQERPWWAFTQQEITLPVIAAAAAEPVQVDPDDPPPPAAIDDVGRHEPRENDDGYHEEPMPGKWKRRNLFDLDFSNRSKW